MSIYQITVPILTKGLEAILRMIDKAEIFTVEKKIDISELIEARLYPDMFSFRQQVGYAYFMALEIVEPVARSPRPALSYDEKDWDELRASVNKVLDYLKKIKPEQMDVGEDRPIPFYWEKSKNMPALKYVKMIGWPNFYFHVTTAYAILRSKGVPLMKEDYINEITN